MRPQDRRRRPLTPIFNPEILHGSINVGVTPISSRARRVRPALETDTALPISAVITPPYDWFGDSAPGVGPAVSPTYTGQSLALAIACITRLNAEESPGLAQTADGYSLGSTGFDGHGGANGAFTLGVEFGTRSRLCYREDWLNFLAGDEHQLINNAADHANSVAFYKLNYPWKVKQTKSAANSGTALSVTLDNPVSAGSIVIVGVACLSANSVSVGPTNFNVDGTTDEPTQRTSRMTAFNSRGVDQTGEDTYTATLSSSTGGGAIIAVEIAREDSLDTALSTAIRAQSGLLLYYPQHHSLSSIEKSWGGSLTTNLTSFGNFTNYSIAGSDGRKYAEHVSGVNPAVIGDNDEFTPRGNGGLTVGFVVNPQSLATLQALVSKNDSGSNFAKEWEIYIDTDGSLTARTCINFAVPPASARQRTSAASLMSTGTWYFVIVRFGNGAGDFPTIRVNGSAITGTTSGSSDANANSSAAVVVGGAYLNSTSRAARSAMGHVFLVGSSISDGDCATIEAAAQADGWF